MESSKLFAKIKDLGQANSKREELKEYCKLKFDQILKFLPEQILHSNGADLLNSILNGLPDYEAGTSKCKIIELVLKIMRKESTSLTHTGDVISRLCLDLSRLPAQDLVRISSDTIQSIVEDQDVNMIWKDVLPECLNGLSSHNQIKHCGTEMSPAEFKEQCVRTLCQCKWKEGQLIQLAAMFKDMQLSREDHRQVVNKLCTYILDVPPETLPPLVHQLVKLCKAQNVEIVLFNLAHYFNVRLYSKLQPTLSDSESTTLDIDEFVPYSSAELSRCLSTCIYHITQGAAEPETVRKHLRLWPKYQLLRSPFLLELALALSDKGADFRSVCIDIIKSAIERRVLDSIKAKESAWIRAVLPAEVDVASVLKVLTAGSGNELELTVIGLINLAFALLATPRTKATSSICHSYGKLILVRLCKSRSEVASHIMSQLADRLAGDSATHRQYADCLYVLCKLTPQHIDRCPALIAILENCQPTGSDHRAAAAVFDAVHPLLQFSTGCRDSMLMVCRKGLYSRDSAHRCLALSGFLTLLRHVKLPRAAGSSQSACSDQYSAHSYLTQLCVDLHATQHGPVTSRVRNEAMCMEVVSILRRCLVQDAAVKQLLYSSLYLCAKEKLVLHESILELLHEHLSRYIPETDDVGAALLFDKCVHTTTINAVLTEPIGHLLFATAQFLQPIHDEELEDILSSQGADSGSACLKGQLQSLMGRLLAAGRLATVDVEDLTDLTPESKAKSLKVQQILQCYEALIAYLVMSWNASDKNVVSNTYNMLKHYNELLDKSKAPPKISKKTSKSTLNGTRETVATQKSQKSQKSQKDKGKKPMKFTNLVKDKAGPFKALPCLWDLPFCLRIMELLYASEVPWSSLEQRNHLRTKRDFHHFALRCVQAVLAGDWLDKRTVAAVVPKLARLLFERCLSRYQDMCDFDDLTTQYCIDVFKDCLTVMLSPNYGFKIDTFLPTIANLPDSPPSTCIAAILEQIHSSLSHLESASEEEARDATERKLATSLMQTGALLLGVPGGACARGTSIMSKLEEYVRSSKHECLQLISALLDATCRLNQDGQLLDQLIDKLTVALGRIDEEDSSVGAESTDFPSIDDRSGQAVLASTCLHITARIGHVLVLITRANVPANTAHLYGDRERAEQKELYKSLIMQLCQLCIWTSSVCALRCVVGAGGSEKVVAACVRLYGALAAAFKGVDIAVLHDIRLERLLKLSGKKLSTVCDSLITYLEASQPQQQAAHKVMRDMKLIPRLVLEAEQYTKHVLLLENKAKMNFSQYLSLGTARDFRIKAPVLQQVLNADADDTRNDTADVANEINDAETTLLSANGDADTVEGGKRKKRRVS